MVPDESAVKEFTTASADPGFDDRVYLGRLDAAEHCPDPGAVADHELDPVGLVAEIHDQVAGLLGSPCVPRCALSYPRFSREELGGRFLGLMAYPMLKGGWGKEHAS